MFAVGDGGAELRGALVSPHPEGTEGENPSAWSQIRHAAGIAGRRFEGWAVQGAAPAWRDRRRSPIAGGRGRRPDQVEVEAHPIGEEGDGRSGVPGPRGPGAVMSRGGEEMIKRIL